MKLSHLFSALLASAVLTAPLAAAEAAAKEPAKEPAKKAKAPAKAKAKKTSRKLTLEEATKVATTSKQMCPSAVPTDKAWYWAKNSYPLLVTHGYNSNFIDYYSGPGKSKVHFRKRTTWRYPSLLLNMGDAITPTIHPNTFFDETYTADQRMMEARHNNGCNILFGDGHVANWKMMEIPSEKYGSVYKKAFWAPDAQTGAIR